MPLVPMAWLKTSNPEAAIMVAVAVCRVVGSITAREGRIFLVAIAGWKKTHTHIPQNSMISQTCTFARNWISAADVPITTNLF